MAGPPSCWVARRKPYPGGCTRPGRCSRRGCALTWVRCPMKCEKIERWISDDLDGALMPGKRPRLEAHLSACPACREYRKKARRIQAASVRLAEPEVSPESLEALSAEIRRKLRH